MEHTVVGKSIYIPKSAIAETTAQPPRAGKNLLEPFKSFAENAGLPFKVLEVHESVYEAEIHKRICDLWYCLEGEAVFELGGELVDPWMKKNADGSEDSYELKASAIRGGKEVRLLPGDWLWIPAGEAHQHKTKGTARLVIVRMKAEL